MRPRDEGSTTVRRALSLLDILGQHAQGAGLSEIARRAKLHHATVYRLLSTLAAAGFVAYGPETRKYRLGLKILDLAGNLLANIELREAARPTLLRLAAQTGETVHLATLDQDEMVFLDRVDGLQPVTLRTRVGFRAPVHVTAVGKAFLAFSSPAAVERVLQSMPLLRHTEHTITDRATFLGHLETVRRQGFAVDNEEHRLTIRCVGAPILDHAGIPMAAVSIAGPMFRLSSRRIRALATLVKEAATHISAALGHAVGRAAPLRPLMPTHKNGPQPVALKERGR
ncbi:MAG: IclR family transcriptional regulator [Candidatus Rokuibacteriota bacterium]